MKGESHRLGNLEPGECRRRSQNFGVVYAGHRVQMNNTAKQAEIFVCSNLPFFRLEKLKG